MKKYCFLINSLRIGGAERVCVELINEFYQEGYKIDLIVLNTQNAPLVSRLNAGINIINLEIGHARNAFFPIKRVLEQGKYDACLVFNPQLAVLLVLMRFFYRNLKFSLIARNINTLSEKLKLEKSIRHKYLNGTLIKFLYRNADVFIAQSKGMRDDMVATLGIPESKIITIFNPKIKGPEEKFLNIELKERDKKEILFAGSLKAQKNLSFLLESISVLKKRRADFILRIVGDGECRSELEKRVLELGLNEFVRFEGKSTNIDAYYRNADVVVLTSWYEGFPNVLVEALSYNVPVVSVNCKSGPDDIIVDNLNGFLVEGYDRDSFSQKLNEALCKKWNKIEIQNTTKKFSFETIYKQYKSVLVDKKT